MKLDTKKLEELKAEGLNSKEIHQRVKNWLNSVTPAEAPALLVSLAKEESLSDDVRTSVVSMMGYRDRSHQTIQFLRQLIHDKSRSQEFRSQALSSFVVSNTDLRHVDLMALLADTSEEIWMRAEAAAALGGSGCEVERAEGLIKSILARDDLHEELAFWCIYACTCFEESEDKDALVLLISRYLEDHRVVLPPIARSLMSCPATVSMEASWVIDSLDGIIRDPEWEKSP